MNNNVVMIKREKLKPHPDNPRKDLGDLAELTESIKEHGVMQNLTVVPDGDKYKVLIGHRRLAASDGVLDELPCVIVDGLTDREQVGIMLCENMQRSDLTYMEQAHGFQMMLDLGDTVETISQKTGFSKSTIKHRLAITELDKNVLKEASKWFQPTISDFIALEKVKDLKKRNEILEEATNSRDLQDEVEEYVEECKRKENFEYYAKIFRDAGLTEQNKDHYFYYRDEYQRTNTIIDDIDLDKSRIPEKTLREAIGGVKGVLHFGRSYRSMMVRIYRESKKQSRDDAIAKQKEKEAQLKKNRRALRDIQAEICDSYMQLILDSTISYNIPISTLFCLVDLGRDMCCTLYNLNEKVMYRASIVSKKGYESPDNNPLKDFLDWTPAFQLLANLWWSLASDYMSFADHAGYANTKTLNYHKVFQDILKEELGYKPRKEWEPILDGTSELYQKGGKK